ncbi:MAG TPA: NADH-quinone oxidoreductase subunit NuoN [Aeromicrobium sp.]|nr:NADH-quinone oxidoreductase subunit NuoN [Aeromicrobium sp.]
MTPIAAPHVEYALIAPILIVSGGAVLATLVEALLPRRGRFAAQAGLAAATVVAALIDTVWVYRSLDAIGDLGRGQISTEGALAVDGPGVLTWGFVLVFALLSVAMFAERRLEGGLSAFTGRAADAPGSAGEAQARSAGLEHTEVFPLALFAVLGMMVFATANDLLTMFVALEVLSLPLYVLCGLARRRRILSQEAALKYFLLGAFSSAFFAYGIALAYGYAGGMQLADIDRAVASRQDGGNLLLAAIGLMAVGLLFKVGAVPFHSWTPDVYQGAPTPVTAFMAAGTKAAAMVALMRVLYVSFGGAAVDWRPLLAAVAVATMVLGSLVAIAQTDVKRMLGYSSVAHAGFLIVGVAGAFAAAGRITSISSVLFYLFAYGVSTIGAFAVVTVVRGPAASGGGEATHLSHWAGLGKVSPPMAGAFAIFLLSFAGIPLTGGFIGKWGVFAAAMSGGFWPLVVIGVLVSAVAAYFYVRVIVVMFFTDPVGDGPDVIVPSGLTTVVIAVAAIVTLGLGILPGPALDLVQHAGLFVR